jgi:hypothetical protein
MGTQREHNGNIMGIQQEHKSEYHITNNHGVSPVPPCLGTGHLHQNLKKIRIEKSTQQK